MKRSFSPREQAALAIAQGDIPRSLTPFADMATATGLSEAEILDLLRNLKNDGVIRRFGASLRHQRAGWTCNAMVAWQATPAQADVAGPIAAVHPRVSHAYYRPSTAHDWPYAFYTMVHGQSGEECERTINELARSCGLSRYAVLRSLRELKKTSMRYFV